MNTENGSTHYLFDVDGTLTPPKRSMTTHMVFHFLQWSRNKSIFIVAGSDKKALDSQLPSSILSRCEGVFSSMGNELHIGEKKVYSNEWNPPTNLINYLESLYENSKYPEDPMGAVIEERPGMLNFCIPGRNSNSDSRLNYYMWDSEHRQRVTFMEEIQNKFPDLETRLGGQTSIDIQPTGNNKSQASKWVRDNKEGAKIFFFGDKCFKNGNDYDIMLDIENHEDGKVFKVNNYTDTLELLTENL